MGDTESFPGQKEFFKNGADAFEGKGRPNHSAIRSGSPT